MSNIFEIAKICLQNANIDEKLALTHKIRHEDCSRMVSFISKVPPENIDKTVFPNQPTILPPRKMPRRNLTSSEGVAAFFHALAHIEFVAIYLAWDLIYRFRDLPKEFYQDWLRVADEEAQHFELIRSYLLGFGIDYGDLPAHGGLWDHAQQTADNLLARLAIVPRCMEARGLDVTPSMIEKFERAGNQKAEAILNRILDEEIGHVQLGSKWFRYKCRQLSLDPSEAYIDLIQQHFKGKPKGPFNRKLRIISGFSNAELDWLENE